MACRRQPAASEAQKDKSLIVSLCLKCACGFAQAPISGLWFSPIWNCGLRFCPSWRGKSVAHSPNSSVTKLHRWLVEVGDYTISGAHDARPGRAYIPILESIFVSVFRSTCLVSTSAGFSLPKTLHSSTVPERTFSCAHKSATSRCLTLPNPRRRHIPRAAVASEWMRILSVIPNITCNALHAEPLTYAGVDAVKFRLSG